MPDIKTLKRIAAGVGIAGLFGTFYCINKVPSVYNKAIRNLEEYKQAMQLVNSHPEAVKYLGEPIEAGAVDVTDEKKFGYDDKKMWMSVPIKGPKGTGKLFYDFLLRQDVNDPINILNVELMVDDIKNYKLIIKK